jgi:ankyrin repeat protein
VKPPLIDAVQKKDVERVKSLLKALSPFALNLRDMQGNTALHFAAEGKSISSYDQHLPFSDRNK